MSKKNKPRITRCPYCKKCLGRIWFEGKIIEEWFWSNGGYNEIGPHPYIVWNPRAKVICPECYRVIGKPSDFGFKFGKYIHY